MIALAARPISAKSIIRVLTGAPDGVASSDWLARCLECEPEDLIEPLARLAGRRRVLVWSASPGVLGVILARTNRPDPEPTLNGPVTGLDLDRVPDRRTLDRDPAGVPYPGLILLGERLPWPPPDWVPRQPCWACGGRRLSVDSYCLVCDRAGRGVRTWGVRREAEPIRRAVGDDGLAGGTGPVDLDDLDRELKRMGAAQADRNRSAYGMDPAKVARD